jgi:hypothetical protein
MAVQRKFIVKKEITGTDAASFEHVGTADMAAAPPSPPTVIPEDAIVSAAVSSVTQRPIYTTTHTLVEAGHLVMLPESDLRSVSFAEATFLS